jgi:prepilin-type N-terminal cleavage/methylation domain-containing protein
MRMKKVSRGESGFSLIEVLVAVVILTVGLLSLAQLMVLATNSNQLSGRMTSSASIAKERLELLKAAPFYTNVAAKVVNPLLTAGGDLNNNAGGYFQYYDADGRPLPGQAGALYLVRWQIQTVVPPAGAGALPLAMLRISVRALPAVENNNMFQFIGDATFTTFRTANVA